MRHAPCSSVPLTAPPLSTILALCFGKNDLSCVVRIPGFGPPEFLFLPPPSLHAINSLILFPMLHESDPSIPFSFGSTSSSFIFSLSAPSAGVNPSPPGDPCSFFQSLPVLMTIFVISSNSALLSLYSPLQRAQIFLSPSFESVLFPDSVSSGPQPFSCFIRSLLGIYPVKSGTSSLFSTQTGCFLFIQTLQAFCKVFPSFI